MKPGYENLAQRRPPAYETSDYATTITPAETRAGTMAQRRASWQGRGQSGRGRASTPQPAAPADVELQALQMRTRLIELGA
jgi:hypothetical protein